MKIDTSQGNVEVIGDIKEFKTSIDPKNLEFVTTLLSSNLYSDPEQSFIREIVSNAWDSHVEAGTTDTPVIVRFRSSGTNNSVTIRDYGVGLSPERFKEVYCNIGSSTKRESNDYIGGFGIGKYSSLACSNTVYITSYYEGTAYYYVMVKSGNSITTNLLMKCATSEKNGVEVTIKCIENLSLFNKALQCIVFFPNIYIDGARDADLINCAKLKRFKNFAAASISVPSKLLLGNVLYPLQVYHLNLEAKSFISKIEDTGVVIKFDVGELNITPNRENIIYSSDTISKIEDRIKNAKEELETLINTKVTKDYSDIVEYYKFIDSPIYYDPVSDSIKTYGCYYRCNPLEMSNTPITCNSVDLRDDFRNLSNILKMHLPNFKGVVCDDRIYLKRLPWNIRDEDRLKTPKLLVLNSGARLTELAKSYIRRKYDKYGIITDISKDDFYNWLKKEVGQPIISSDNFDFIANNIYQSMMNKAERLDLNNDPEFLKYKANAANKTTSIKDDKEVILYVWSDMGYKDKKVFKKFHEAIDYIKSLKRGVVLSGMESDDELLSAISRLKGFTYMKARKSTVSDIREMKLKCIVDIDWLLNKDRTLSIVNTIHRYFPDGVPENLVYEISYSVREDLQEGFLGLSKISHIYYKNYYYRSIASRDNIPYDSYTEYLCLKLKDYIDKYSRVRELSTSVGCYNYALTSAIILKTKSYRINSKTYNTIKTNKLLNVLCRK